MILRSLVLQNFRSYTQADFSFSEDTTVIIGPNTAGKTNLAEAIHLLSTGRSFKGPTDSGLIHFGKEIGRIKAAVTERTEKSTETQREEEKITLEVVLMSPQYNNGRFGKKYLVNDVSKSRANFLGFLPLVLFRPEELDIIIDGPSVRRNFLDEVLEQVDREYVVSSFAYERALKQRNALLQRVREVTPYAEAKEQYKEQFAYWDGLVIENGQYIAKKREEFIDWINNQAKEVIDFTLVYDHSKISPERLLEYKDAEVAAGVTLVGPHRDDFYITINRPTPEVKGPDTSGVSSQQMDIRVFGSRGQQRLVVLQLKLLQIQFTREKLQKKPLLVLDDIFSELDSGHIQLVFEKISGQQAIITTTHKEFIPKEKLHSYSVIELNSENSEYSDSQRF